MGYYTTYDLNIIYGDASLLENPAFISDFERITGCCFSSLSVDFIKWYDNDNDMLELSKLYPNYVFHLEGVGEETDDRWIMYYHNGHFQNANLRYIHDPFDPSTGNCQTNYPDILI